MTCPAGPQAPAENDIKKMPMPARYAVRARDDTKTTPILVLTTESSADLKSRARDAGATGWIVKPFAQDKLVRALRMVAG